MQRIGVKVTAASIAMVCVLAGCSQPNREERATADMAPMDVSEGNASYRSNGGAAASAEIAGAPAIAPTAAPGVAFNYRYAFRLPNNRIAAVQEQHAQTCEKLGIAKCRITGMRYSLVDGDDVSAYLQFKLAPELARQFGKDGIAAVTAAEGMLVDSEISGTDEGSNIKQSAVRSAGVRDRLADVERQLARGDLKGAERAQLQQQAENLRNQLDNEAQSRSDSEEALANTPMTFHYGSGSTIPGFDGSSPLKESWRAAVSSFMTMLGFVLLAVGISLPWLLLAALVVALWRTKPMRGVRNWFAGQRTKSGLDELAHQQAKTSHKASEENLV